MTKFFVNQSETFKVWFLIEKNSGKPVIFSSIEEYIEYFKLISPDDVELHFYEFIIWTWGMDNFIRELSTDTDPITGGRKFNAAAWRENKFRFLLVDWSLTDATGAKIPLVREDNHGRAQLNDASFKRVLSVLHAINKVVLSFADKVLLEGEAPEALLNDEDYKLVMKGQHPTRTLNPVGTPPKN